MDYKEKYNAALERARKEWVENLDNCYTNYRERLEIIFPELKESEDDKIRKAIHIYLDWLDGRKDYAPKGIYSIKDMIAWLEKQGKKLDTDKVIAWLVANICDFEFYVKRFKQDFGL